MSDAETGQTEGDGVENTEDHQLEEMLIFGNGQLPQENLSYFSHGTEHLTVIRFFHPSPLIDLIGLVASEEGEDHKENGTVQEEAARMVSIITQTLLQSGLSSQEHIKEAFTRLPST